MWFLIFGVLGAVGAFAWYEQRKFSQSGWTPVATGPAAPLPTAPAGVVPTSPSPSGGVLVTLVPGNMGTLKVANASGFPSPGVAVQVQPPGGGNTGIGWIGGVTSDNQNVAATVGILVHPGQPGQMSAPLNITGPGTANIAVQWNDGATSQTTTFTISAS